MQGKVWWVTSTLGGRFPSRLPCICVYKLTTIESNTEDRRCHKEPVLVMLMVNRTCRFAMFTYYSEMSFQIQRAQKYKLYFFAFSGFSYFSLLILPTVKSESHGTLPKCILHLNPFRCIFYLNRAPEVFWCSFFTQIIAIWILYVPVQTCLELREWKDVGQNKDFTQGDKCGSNTSLRRKQIILVLAQAFLFIYKINFQK